MNEQAPGEVTRILGEWRAGDPEALNRLVPLVYEELKGLAGARLRGERPDHTLSATALVHEAYVRLVLAEVDWKDRAHFFAVAARAMRRVLVEHARSRARAKRGGGWHRTTLGDGAGAAHPPSDDLLDLAEALKYLEDKDIRASRLIELRYLGGLSIQEIAEVEQISPATIHRDLAAAKEKLREQLDR